MEKTITILLDRLEEKIITINQLKQDLRHYETLEVHKTGNLVEQLKKDYNTIAQRCNDLEEQNDALINKESETIKSLNTELEKKEIIIAELKADIEARDAYIVQLEAKVDDFRQQIASQPVSNSKGKPGNPNLNADICKGAGYLIYRECEDSRETGRIFLEFHYEDELASLSKYIGGAKGWNVKAKHACFSDKLINGWQIRRASYDESSMCYDFLDKDGKSFQRLDTVALNIL